MRVLLGCLGVVVGGYGGWLLLTTQDRTAVVAAGVWLVAGVVLHDAVLAPVLVVLGWFAVRALPRPAAAGAVVGLVAFGPIALVAVPVLVRPTEPGIYPTLLPRDYPLGLLEVAVASLGLAVLVALVVLRSTKNDPRRPGGADPGRR